jgi:hypothetical protein
MSDNDERIRRMVLDNLEQPGQHFLGDIIATVTQVGDFNAEDVKDVVWSMIHKRTIIATSDWRLVHARPYRGQVETKTEAGYKGDWPASHSSQPRRSDMRILAWLQWQGSGKCIAKLLASSNQRAS